MHSLVIHFQHHSKKLFSRIVLYEYVYCMQGRHALVIFEGAQVCVCVCVGGGGQYLIFYQILKNIILLFFIFWKLHSKFTWLKSEARAPHFQWAVTAFNLLNLQLTFAF